MSTFLLFALFSFEPEPLIHGEAASEAEFPMAGALLLSATAQTDDGQQPTGFAFECSSVLIAPDVVLTAAHCVDQALFTAAGLTDVKFHWTRTADLFDYAVSLELGEAIDEAPSDAIEVIGTVIHPEFDVRYQPDGLDRAWDLGLVFLAEPVLDVPLARLPDADGPDGVALDVEATVIGWGQQFGNDPPEEPTPFVGVKRQGLSPIAAVGEFEFQLGAAPTDPRQCQGDSGGPVFARSNPDDPASLRVVGIASRTYDQTLCEALGATNTRVQPYRAWVEAEMIAACESGLRSWCDVAGLPPPGSPDEDEDEDEDGGCNIVPVGSRGGSLLVLCVLGAAHRRRRPRSAP